MDIKQQAIDAMAEYDAQIRDGGEPAYPQWAADFLNAKALIDKQANQIATDEAVLGMTPTNDKVDQSGADERLIKIADWLSLHVDVAQYSPDEPSDFKSQFDYELAACVDELRSIAALKANLYNSDKQNTIPKGWKLVPMEPTHEMLAEAGCRLSREIRANTTLEFQSDAHIAWDGMLATAPSVPANPNAIPEGWKLVQIKATKEMIKAAYERSNDGTTHMCFKTWDAMVAAAPSIATPANMPASEVAMEDDGLDSRDYREEQCTAEEIAEIRKTQAKALTDEQQAARFCEAMRKAFHCRDLDDDQIIAEKGAMYQGWLLASQPSAPADVAAVRDAALVVVNAALEGAEDNVHVCDRNNVEAKLQTIQPEVVALYRALKSAAPTAQPQADGVKP